MDRVFTIKDLAEGRVAVKNDGTLEELKRVIGKAFPSSRPLLGDGTFYRKSDFETNEWFSYENQSLFPTPVQSVKVFVQQLDEFEKSLPVQQNDFFKKLIPFNPDPIQSKDVTPKNYVYVKTVKGQSVRIELSNGAIIEIQDK